MKRRAGYMLLEVVLALSIFVVAVVGLLRCLSAGLDANYQQQRQTNTRLNLQSIFDQSLGEPLQEGSKDFPTDAFSVGYRRVVKATPVKISGGRELKGIFKVTVMALDKKRDNRVIGELWTYVSG